MAPKHFARADVAVQMKTKMCVRLYWKKHGASPRVLTKLAPKCLPRAHVGAQVLGKK